MPAATAPFARRPSRRRGSRRRPSCSRAPPEPVAPVGQTAGMSDPVTMTVDEALSTTRAVRKRLDLTKPVPRAVLLECLELAFQAPNGSNRQLWQWVVVDDAETRAQM